MPKYVPTYRLEAEIWIREDLVKRIGQDTYHAQAEAVRIILESRFAGFRIAGFKIVEVKVK